jgi:hypothetical protein
VSSDVDRLARRTRRQRNLAQRDSWGKNKSGPMRDQSKSRRKPKHLDEDLGFVEPTLR